MPKRDVQATAAKRFKDPRSFVWKDGREQLYEADWQDRKYELLLRARGQCEYLTAGDQRCQREGTEPHHRILRSTLRDDRLNRLQLVCNFHHRALDREQRKIHGKNKIGFNPEAALEG